MDRIVERNKNDIKIIKTWNDSCRVRRSELKQLQLLLVKCEFIEDKKAERIPYTNVFMVYERVFDNVKKK